MKHLYTLCIVLVLSMQQTFAQTYTFNWATGVLFNLIGGLLTSNVNNVNSSTVNATITVGSNQPNALSSYTGFSSSSPTVANSPFTTQYWSDVPNLAVGVNFTDKAKYADILIQFSSTVKNVKFNIADIDRASNSSNTYDEVVITAYNGATAVGSPAISKLWDLWNGNISISGNTVTGSGINSGSSGLEQLCSIEVDFGNTMLTSVNVRLRATGSETNPDPQAIGIGNISFQRAVVLPVTLTSFNGALNNNSVKLNWESAQEVNLDKYIVEKSTDGINWQLLTTVMASGNSNNAKEYNAVDANAAQINYYRLKQVDLNGSFTYSQLIRIRNGEPKKLAVKLYPNPVTGNATVTINSESKLAAHLKIYNQFGLQVQHMQRSLIAGSNNISVPGINTLPAGTYIVVVEDDKLNRIGTTQFVKQ